MVSAEDGRSSFPLGWAHAFCEELLPLLIPPLPLAPPPEEPPLDWPLLPPPELPEEEPFAGSLDDRGAAAVAADPDPAGVGGGDARRARSARSSPRVDPCGQLKGSGGGS